MGFIIGSVIGALLIINGILAYYLVRRQNQQAEDVKFALFYLTEALRSLNTSVEHSLDCLVTLDAQIDSASHPSETEANAVKC